MDANIHAPYERSTYSFEAEYAIVCGGDKQMYHATLRDPLGKYSTKTFHISTKSTTGKYPCTENWPHSNERCPSSYATPSLLKEHLALFHNRKPILCNLCPRILGDKSGAETHAKLHLEGSRYQCPMCTYCAQRRDNVLRHIKTQHRAEGAEPVDLKRTLGDNLPPRTQKRRRQTNNDDAATTVYPRQKRQQEAQAVNDTAALTDLAVILPLALSQESSTPTDGYNTSAATTASNTATNTAATTPSTCPSLDLANLHVNINSPETMFYGKPFHVWADGLLKSDPFLTA